MLSSVSEREKQMLYIVVHTIQMGLVKGERSQELGVLGILAGSRERRPLVHN